MRQHSYLRSIHFLLFAILQLALLGTAPHAQEKESSPSQAIGDPDTNVVIQAAKDRLADQTTRRQVTSPFTTADQITFSFTEQSAIAPTDCSTPSHSRALPHQTFARAPPALS